MSAITEEVECLECTEPIKPGEDESTYCGSVHQEECHEKHLRHWAVCDEDAQFHGEGGEEIEDAED